MGLSSEGVSLEGSPWQGDLLGRGGVSLEGVSLAGGCLPGRGVVSLAGGVSLAGVSLAGDPPWQTPLFNRMTDACENITLPQTSFAGGNKVVWALINNDQEMESLFRPLNEPAIVMVHYACGLQEVFHFRIL